MTRQMISAAISQISDGYVTEAAEYKTALRAPRRPWRWLAVAASIVLIFGVGVLSAWFFMPSDTWGASTNALQLTVVRVDDKMASYAFVDMSPYERAAIASWRGEFYRRHGDASFYRVKGQDELFRLILDNGEGLHLVEFEAWIQQMSAERWRTSYWYECGYVTEADIAALTAESEIYYGDTLRIIYGVESAQDIVSVQFEDADIDRSDIGDSIKIKSVTLRDGESLVRMYAILCGMTEREAWAGWVRIFAHDEQYKNGTLPLSEQTERQVTVTLAGGYKLRLDYSPTSSIIKKHGVEVGVKLSEADNAWLITAAGIDMQYRYYGDAEFYEVSGEVTTSPPTQPTE